MTKLAQLLLAYLVSSTSPGRSVHSFEAVPDCGTDPKHATCELKRECDPTLVAGLSGPNLDHATASSPLCTAPRWSAARHAWVRPERRATALRRYREGADVLAQVATRLIHCFDDENGVQEDCIPAAGWPRGRAQETSLALSGLTAVIWESGGREDIWFSHPPLGLGPSGEVCSMQIMPQHALDYAYWLPKDEREQLQKTLSIKERIDWAYRELKGRENYAHCFEVGLRALARARSACRGKGVAWDYGMFSMYGTGSRCVAGQFALDRSRTFQKFWSLRKKTVLPDADAAIALASFTSVN